MKPPPKAGTATSPTLKETSYRAGSESPTTPVSLAVSPNALSGSSETASETHGHACTLVAGASISREGFRERAKRALPHEQTSSSARVPFRHRAPVRTAPTTRSPPIDAAVRPGAKGTAASARSVASLLSAPSATARGQLRLLLAVDDRKPAAGFGQDVE